MPRLCTLLLLSISVLLATARPVSFKSQRFERDGHQLKRQASEGNIVEEYNFQPSVVLLDQTEDLLHVECLATEVVFTFATGLAPMYNQSTIFIGGREWNCTNVNGTVDPVVIRGDVITRHGDEVHVQGQQPSIEEIFTSFKMVVNKTEVDNKQKRGEYSNSLDLGTYNYNSYKNSAIRNLTMLHQTCNSSDLSNQAQEFCRNGGKLQNTIQCTDCYLRNSAQMNIEYSIGSLSVVVEGKMTINTQLFGESASTIQKSFLLQEAIPFTGISLFGVMDLNVETNLVISADFVWKNTGTFNAGGQISVYYGFDSSKKTNHSSAEFLPSAPGGGASGESTARLSIDVGPRLSLTLVNTKLFAAKLSVKPWIQLGVSYALPAFPAKIAPTASETIFYNPTFGYGCTSPHYVEWNITVGANLFLTIEKAKFAEDQKFQFFDGRLARPLAKGCLLTDNFNGTPQKVKFYFDKKITELNLSGMTFQSLLLQDLKSIVGTNVQGNVTLQITNNMVEATVILPNYNRDQTAPLQLAADNAEMLNRMQSGSSLVPYAVSTPIPIPTTTAFTDGGYAQIATGATGVIVPGIAVVLMLLASF